MPSIYDLKPAFQYQLRLGACRHHRQPGDAGGDGAVADLTGLEGISFADRSVLF